MTYSSYSPEPSPEPTTTAAAEAPEVGTMSGLEVLDLLDDVTLEPVNGAGDGLYGYWAQGQGAGTDILDTDEKKALSQRYFPIWDALRELDPNSVPFAHFELVKGQRYRIQNTFSTREGFSVKSWFSDDMNVIYGIANDVDNFVEGFNLNRGESFDFIAPSRFVLFGTFDHFIPGDPDPFGYKMNGMLRRVTPNTPPPVIQDDDLMMIQHDPDGEGDLFRIEAYELKSYFSPLAEAEDYVTNNFGTPGLMFPGSTLRYNSVTGKLDADIPAKPNFVGIVTVLQSLPAPFNTFDKLDPHPFNNPFLTTYPVGTEQEGDFYVVFDREDEKGDPGYKLTEAWGSVSGARVFRGDVIVRVRQGDAPGDWEINPNMAGATAVQKIRTTQFSITFDTEADIQRPIINIKTAAAAETETTAADDDTQTEGYDGLLSKGDKNIINRLPVDYTQQDYTIYPAIT